MTDAAAVVLATHAPSKCGTCDRPVDSPLVCSNCHTLIPAETCNHFELLGVPPVFDLDAAELRRRYLESVRQAHPDQFSAVSEAADESQRLSARLNAAYATLNDPLRRAEYLLELHGGASAATDKRVPPQVLAAALEYNERIAEASASGDRDTLEECRRQLRHELDERAAAIAEQARRLHESGAPHEQLRSELNAAKYYQRLLEQVSDT